MAYQFTSLIRLLLSFDSALKMCSILLEKVSEQYFCLVCLDIHGKRGKFFTAPEVTFVTELSALIENYLTTNSFLGPAVDWSGEVRSPAGSASAVA